MRKLLGLVALAALVLTGCEWHPNPYVLADGDGAPNLAVHADSLGHLTERGGDIENEVTLITDALVAEGYSTSRLLLTGQSAIDGRTLVRNWDIEVPDIYVFALGSNDMHAVGGPKDREDASAGTWTLEERIAALEGYLADLDALGVGCVAVLNLPAMSTSWNLDLYAPVWNEVLETSPHVDHVIDWASVAEAHPEEFGKDLIHFDATPGAPMAVAYTQAIADGAAACRG